MWAVLQRFVGLGWLPLILVAAIGLAPESAMAQAPNGTTTESTSRTPDTFDDTELPALQVNMFSTRLIGALQGAPTFHYDETFAFAFDDPAVQDGVLFAQALMASLFGGPLDFSGPTLFSSILSSTSNTVVTVLNAQDVQTLSAELTVGPGVVQIGDRGLCEGLGANNIPFGCVGGVPIAFEVPFGSSNTNFNLNTHTTFTRTLQTTDTFLLTQVYRLTGVPQSVRQVPEPGTLLLLLSGFAAILLGRRRKLAVGAGLLPLVLVAAIGLAPESAMATDSFTYSTSRTEIFDDTVLPTLRVDSFSTRLIGALQGDPTFHYDETFSFAFDDPAVQDGVLFAQAVLASLFGGPLNFSGPTLFSSTLSTTSNTLVTVLNAQEDRQNVLETSTGPGVVQIGDRGLCAGIGANRIPFGCLGGAPIAFELAFGDTNFNSNVNTQTTFTRTLQTTETFLLTQEYRLTGVPQSVRQVPEPGTLLLLLSGFAAILLGRRRKLAAGLGLLPLVLVAAIGLTPQTAAAQAFNSNSNTTTTVSTSRTPDTFEDTVLPALQVNTFSTRLFGMLQGDPTFYYDETFAFAFDDPAVQDGVLFAQTLLASLFGGPLNFSGPSLFSSTLSSTSNIAVAVLSAQDVQTIGFDVVGGPDVVQIGDLGLCAGLDAKNIPFGCVGGAPVAFEIIPGNVNSNANANTQTTFTRTLQTTETFLLTQVYRLTGVPQSVRQVPEPGTLLLLLSGFAAILLGRRRKLAAGAGLLPLILVAAIGLTPHTAAAQSNLTTTESTSRTPDTFEDTVLPALQVNTFSTRLFGTLQGDPTFYYDETFAFAFDDPAVQDGVLFAQTLLASLFGGPLNFSGPTLFSSTLSSTSNTVVTALNAQDVETISLETIAGPSTVQIGDLGLCEGLGANNMPFGCVGGAPIAFEVPFGSSNTNFNTNTYTTFTRTLQTTDTFLLTQVYRLTGVPQSVHQVPEPGTLLLLVIGAAAILLGRRRKLAAGLGLLPLILVATIGLTPQTAAAQASNSTSTVSTSRTPDTFEDTVLSALQVNTFSTRLFGTLQGDPTFYYDETFAFAFDDPAVQDGVLFAQTLLASLFGGPLNFSGPSLFSSTLSSTSNTVVTVLNAQDVQTIGFEFVVGPGVLQTGDRGLCAGLDANNIPFGCVGGTPVAFEIPFGTSNTNTNLNLQTTFTRTLQTTDTFLLTQVYRLTGVPQSVHQVPEPGTLLLLMIGFAAILLGRRRKLTAGLGLLPLVLVASIGLAPQTVSAQASNTTTTVSTSRTPDTFDDTVLPALQVNTFSTRLIGALQGDPTFYYDETFAFAFDDPAVQDGVLFAQALLASLFGGPLNFSGPSLFSSTLSSTSNTVVTVLNAQDVQTLGFDVVVGPDVVQIGDLGLCAALDANNIPFGCVGSAPVAFEIILGNVNTNTNLNLQTTFTRTLQTTDTFLLTQVYRLTGVPQSVHQVPEPGTLLLLMIGAVAILLGRRRKLPAGAGLLPLILVIAIGLTPHIVAAQSSANSTMSQSTSRTPDTFDDTVLPALQVNTFSTRLIGALQGDPTFYYDETFAFGIDDPTVQDGVLFAQTLLASLFGGPLNFSGPSLFSSTLSSTSTTMVTVLGEQEVQTAGFELTVGPGVVQRGDRGLCAGLDANNRPFGCVGGTPIAFEVPFGNQNLNTNLNIQTTFTRTLQTTDTVLLTQVYRLTGVPQSVQQVPEPGTLLLLVIGAAAILLGRRRKLAARAGLRPLILVAAIGLTPHMAAAQSNVTTTVSTSRTPDTFEDTVLPALQVNTFSTRLFGTLQGDPTFYYDETFAFAFDDPTVQDGVLFAQTLLASLFGGPLNFSGPSLFSSTLSSTSNTVVTVLNAQDVQTFGFENIAGPSTVQTGDRGLCVGLDANNIPFGCVGGAPIAFEAPFGTTNTNINTNTYTTFTRTLQTTDTFLLTQVYRLTGVPQSVHQVPEPRTLLLLMIGAAAILLGRWRRFASAAPEGTGS